MPFSIFPRRRLGLARSALLAALVVLLVYTLTHWAGSTRRKTFYHPAYEETILRGPQGDPAIPNIEEISRVQAEKPAEKQHGSSKQGSQPPEPEYVKPKKPAAKPVEPASQGSRDSHPIDKLIADAQTTFSELMSKESKTLEEAAKAYRARRGRHPPPQFDVWYRYAKERGAVIVEEFFDQIYHDLQPFWGMDPAVMRQEASNFEMTIHVRKGVASTTSDWFWTQIWLDMIKSIEDVLPDVDLALNAMDEPRLVVPWTDINGFMKVANTATQFSKAQDTENIYHRLPEPEKIEQRTKIRPKNWESPKHYWKVVRRGCAPDSLVNTVGIQKDFAAPPDIDMSLAEPHLYRGYVSNSTMSTQVCHQPDLQGLEGIFIEPLSTSATSVMFPLFGGSKLSVNNEILLPAPMYWNEEERFTGGDDHGIPWNEKYPVAIWRGVATGGKNHESNWRGFQRHRFVSMNNGTKIGMVENGTSVAENFVLPEKQYQLSAQKDKAVGKWVSSFTDVGFVDLFCDPPQPDMSCNYTGQHFTLLESLKMSDQFTCKYLPDIDGNSFSGRYLGFLRSTSLPIKATLWREWHDSRLVPWKHFVPMDNRFSDYYGIIEYFVGYNGQHGHDSAAEKIAADGKTWAEKVLRKEDMSIYVYRLLLEYARVTDDKRAQMGWVEDMLEKST